MQDKTAGADLGPDIGADLGPDIGADFRPDLGATVFPPWRPAMPYFSEWHVTINSKTAVANGVNAEFAAGHRRFALDAALMYISTTHSKS